MSIPAQPKIYHITHIDNLSGLAASRWIWSDAKRIELGLNCHLVGMSAIKQRRLEKIEGFETLYGMELLATVHWVAKHEDAPTREDAITKVHAWNDRKKLFSDEHIRLTWDVLERKEWLSKDSA